MLYFRFFISILTIFIIIASCNRDDHQYINGQDVLYLDEVQKSFESHFNPDAFPLLETPRWHESRKYLKGVNEYFEIPFTDMSKINMTKSNSLSFDRLVAFKSNEGRIDLKLIHYFIQDFENISYDFNYVEYYNLSAFNGFITTYDLNGELLNIERYINGQKSNHIYTLKTKKHSNDFYSQKVPEECEQVTELITIETCYFWIYNDGTRGPNIDCYYHSEPNTYEVCEVGGGGSGGSTYIEEEIPVQILDSLTGKAKCLFEKFQNTSTGFSNAIRNFDGDFPVSHLKLSINNNLSSGNYGITRRPEDFVINVEFSNIELSNISDLGGAVAIAHEIIHAEIYRKLMSVAKKADLDMNMTREEQINFINGLKDNFPGLYDYYYARYRPEWNHQMMAQHYRTVIADMVEEFDNYSLSRQMYEDLSWAGLRKIDNLNNTIAWDSLSSNEQNRILQTLSSYFFNGTSNC